MQKCPNNYDYADCFSLTMTSVNALVTCNIFLMDTHTQRHCFTHAAHAGGVITTINALSCIRTVHCSCSHNCNTLDQRSNRTQVTQRHPLLAEAILPGILLTGNSVRSYDRTGTRNFFARMAVVGKCQLTALWSYRITVRNIQLITAYHNTSLPLVH